MKTMPITSMIVNLTSKPNPTDLKQQLHNIMNQDMTKTTHHHKPHPKHQNNPTNYPHTSTNIQRYPSEPLKRCTIPPSPSDQQHH